MSYYITAAYVVQNPETYYPRAGWYADRMEEDNLEVYGPFDTAEEADAACVRQSNEGALA